LFLALTAQIATAAPKIRTIVLRGNLSFSNVLVGTSAQLSMTISNAGNTSFSISSITLPAGFSTTFTTATVAAGKSTNALIKFSPTAAQHYSGTVTVNSSANSGTNTLAISGIGVGQTIALGGNLSFGGVAVNSNAQRTLTITNTGTTNLTVTSISYPAGFSGIFAGVIAPGISTNVTVTFSPTSTTNYSGTVTVNSDKLGGTNTIAASGSGITRVIALGGNLNFGTVLVGTNAHQTLVISNKGTVTLTISNLTYPAGFSGAFSGAIAAGKTTNVTVTFTPTGATNYSGIVTVNSDATSGTNTIAISGSGGTAKAISVTGNMAFGNVTVNSSAQHTLVISNAGSSTLTVSNISVPAGFSGSFSGTIASHTSKNVTITFSPTAVTNYSGTVTVTSDATSGANTVAASGTGAGGLIVLSGNLSFGNVQANTSAQSTLVISNAGTATLNVSSISYPSGFSGSFSGALAPGATTNVTVSFSPMAAIDYGGTVVVKSDAFGGVNTIAASGTGIAGRIMLSGNLNFGNVPINTSAQTTLVISNAGTSTLNVSSISYPSGYSGDFSGAIAPGASTNVTVTFLPTAAIKYSGPVAVNSDALSGTNFITASGTGTRVRITLLGNLNFGNVPVNTTPQQTLVISNSGNATLAVSNITYPAGFSGDFSGMLAPATATNVTVTFSPTDTTNYSGTVTVVSDASAGTNNIAASGTGIAPVISLSGDLGFGGVILGSTGQLTLTITNTGGVVLNVSSITYPVGFSGDFSGALAPGTSTNVTVTFTPATATNYNGTITVNSDAFKGANTVNATGTGIAPTRIISLSGDLNYGGIFEGTTAHLTLTITNSGNSDLTFTNIELPAQYAASITSGILAPGTTTNVDVAFTPPDTNIYNGTLTVDSDATSGADTVNLTGRGTNVANPVIVLSGDLEFGDVMVGSAAHLNLSIANIGNATLTVSNIDCPAGFSSSFQGAIEPGMSTNAAITFSPTAAQPYSGVVTVVSDATSGANTLMASGDAFNYTAGNSTFNGLFYPTNGVTFTNSGYFSGKATSKNTFSGKVRFAGKQYSVSGPISGTGAFSGHIVRKGLSTLNVTLQTGFDGGNLCKGTIGDGTFTAELMANRSVFNTKTNPAPQAGTYTVTIATNSPVLTNGTGTVTITTAGSVKITVMLGDGSKVTQATAVSQDGLVPFFGSLYANKGSILGWFIIGNTVGDELNGTVYWNRPAGPSTVYSNGFSITNSVTGAKN
jgi:hypothetical protein